MPPSTYFHLKITRQQTLPASEKTFRLNTYVESILSRFGTGGITGGGAIVSGKAATA
jgi:hypothetical protein